MRRILQIEVGCCGDCPYYNLRKHKCGMGAVDEGAAQDNFYRDCPLEWKEAHSEQTNDQN